MAGRVGAMCRGRLGTSLLCRGGPSPESPPSGPSLKAFFLSFSWDLSLGNFLYMHRVAIHGNLSEGDPRTFVKTGCPSWMASQDPCGTAEVPPCLSTATCGIQATGAPVSCFSPIPSG